jgi:hypothetical protein
MLRAALATPWKRTVTRVFLQAGMWDVDGRGLVPIKDPVLRQALRDKVNQFDIELATKTTPLVLLFTLFPFGFFKSLF